MYRLGLTPAEYQALRGLLARRLAALGAPTPPFPVAEGESSAACQEIARLTDLLGILGPKAADMPGEVELAATDVSLLLRILPRHLPPSPSPPGPAAAPGTLRVLRRKIDRLARPAPPPLAALRLLVMRLRGAFR